jgi:hypothetical protein
MKAKNGSKTDSAREDAEQAVAVMIRQCSEEGQLIAEDEILVSAGKQGLLTAPPADQSREVNKILNRILKKSGDVHALIAPDGSRRFYSSQFITEAYAVILLQKQGDPLQLIAEIVRQNSRVYPRPVPLDIFTLPPFDLAKKKVLNYIGQMAAIKTYHDIVLVTTSTSREFLYSSLYLEAAHASMLAEWFDVGRANNP